MEVRKRGELRVGGDFTSERVAMQITTYQVEISSCLVMARGGGEDQ